MPEKISWEVDKYEDYIILKVGERTFEFSPKYSGYEGCVDLILKENGEELIHLEDVYIPGSPY